MSNRTPEFRVSYPNVYRPKHNDLNGKAEYSVVALFKKGEDLSGLQKLATEALTKKFGADKKKWPKRLKSPFRDQSERAKDIDGKEVLPLGHESGAKYINLKSDRQPGLVDRKRDPILDESQFYGGCYAWASVRAYAYNVKGNAGVAFGLGNVQKTRDGEPFGNRTTVEDDFEPLQDLENGEEVESVDDLFS